MKKKIRTIDPNKPDPDLILETAKIIKKGGVVAFPSDTCYGLAVNPFDTQAIARLFEIKGRNTDKGIILLVSSIAMLESLTEDLSPFSKSMMKAFWPGPLTLIFKKKQHLPDQLSGTHQNIGIRYPKAQVPIRLIEKVGFPITATSANQSGSATAQTAAEIAESIGDSLDLILDAGHCNRLPSTLLDTTLMPPEILRKGIISQKQIKKFL